MNIIEKTKVSQKVKIYTIYSNMYTKKSSRRFRIEGVIFGGLQAKWVKDFRPMKMVVFAIIIVFLIFLGLGVKYFKWGKNSIGRVIIHQLGTHETGKCIWSDS